MTAYLSISDALAITAHGGWHVRDIGMLESVIHRPQATMYGVELYADLHLKAATLLDSANRLHPLLDGNKRLSLVLADTFLLRNGREIHAGQDEFADFVLTVADTHLTLDKIADWLAERTREI